MGVLSMVVAEQLFWSILSPTRQGVCAVPQRATSLGTWSYSIDQGSTFTNFPTASENGQDAAEAKMENLCDGNANFTGMGVYLVHIIIISILMYSVVLVSKRNKTKSWQDFVANNKALYLK